MPPVQEAPTRLSAVLHQIMEDRGIVSQRELARLSGVSHKVINMIAHGHIPMASTLHSIEQGLGLKRNDLLIAAGYIEEPTAIRPQISRIVSILESLSLEDVQDVVDYIQFRYIRRGKRGN